MNRNEKTVAGAGSGTPEVPGITSGSPSRSTVEPVTDSSSGWRGIETPFGGIAVRWEDGALTGVDLEPETMVGAVADPPPGVDAQLAAYLRDGLSRFDLPLELRGTRFQLRVWQALQAIPPGTTRTYGELAAALRTSARAIGGACRANPCPIVVPCHRVVAKHGLGGFAGDTSGRKLAIKRWLLRHEGVELDGVNEPQRNANGLDCNSTEQACCPGPVLHR